MKKVGIEYNLDSLLQRFNIYLIHSKFLNYKTANDYLYIIEEFIQIIDYKDSISRLEKISSAEYNKYLFHLYEVKKNKTITVSKKLSGLKKFNIFLKEEYDLDMKITFVYPKIEKKLLKYLSEEEMFLLLDNMEHNSFLKLRNKVILELLYSSGIRVSELINIKIGDIHSIDKQINIIGKFNKERIVHYSKTTQVYLKKYLLDLKDKYTISANMYLFLSKNHKKLNRNAINYIIKNECKRNNMELISPHIFIYKEYKFTIRSFINYNYTKVYTYRYKRIKKTI